MKMQVKRRSRRAMAVVAVVCGLLATVFPTPTVTASSGSAELEKAACSLTPEELLATYHGYREDRSGQLMAIPQEPNFVGGGLPHAGPWEYLQRVPLFFYGPGYVKPVGKINDTATLADIAPTEADILNFDGFTAPDGHSLDQILEKPRKRQVPPKLILTLVWDGSGRDVLDAWPNDWKNLQDLIPDGAWFDNAVVASSPSDTPPSHATIGTGAYPNKHGILDQTQELAGDIVTPWGAGPVLLIRPTLADIYDRDMNNEPIVGGIASLGAHLGMVGHGSMWGGGDKDIAINRENLDNEGDEGLEWNLRPTIGEFFDFPHYVNKLPSLTEYNRAVDVSDGAADNKWLGTPFADLRNGWDSPARVPYQAKVVDTVIKREKFGKDDVPDLLFVNYKTIDNIGHKFSANSPEMRDTVHAQDADLTELIDLLNKRVGEGKWVMVITADHGSQQDPALTGGHPVSPNVLQTAIEQKFPGAVKNIRPTEVWVNGSVNGNSLISLAKDMMTFTEAQLPDPQYPGDGGKMYQAVFPGTMMQKLPCLQSALRKEAKATRQQTRILSGKAPAPSTDGQPDPANTNLTGGGSDGQAPDSGAAGNG